MGGGRRQAWRELGGRDTGPARVDLAVTTLKDPPVRPRVAEVAGPLDERVIALDHLERMRAVILNGHFGREALVSAAEAS